MEKANVKEIYKLPDEVQYCKRCVISNQRPRIVFDEEGVCNGCRYTEYKNNVIEWAAKERELIELLDKHRSKDGSWDCIVPSSGGKDSCHVAYQLKEVYGMNPLTVTWAPLSYTDIGRQNFHAHIDAGYDNICGSPNGAVQRRLCKEAMIAMGDPFQPFVYGQVLYPLKIALKFGIKLIFSGENAEAEYGGSLKAWDSKGYTMDNYNDWWFSQFPVEYWLEHGFTRAELQSHLSPSKDDVVAAGIERYFFGYFKKWIHQENYYEAAEHMGFKPNTERTQGTYTKYSSIDDKFDGFHHYFALLKFGISRCTANSSREIRDGNITREEGVALVHRFDAEFPDRYYQEFLDYIGITDKEFWEIADRWRNEHMWKKVGNEWSLRQQVS